MENIVNSIDTENLQTFQVEKKLLAPIEPKTIVVLRKSLEVKEKVDQGQGI